MAFNISFWYPQMTAAERPLLNISFSEWRGIPQTGHRSPALEKQNPKSSSELSPQRSKFSQPQGLHLPYSFR